MADAGIAAGEGRIADDSVVAELLRARRETAGAGNRRTLFARFDALLDGAAVNVGEDPVASAGRGGGDGVELRRVALRNWRSFEDAELILPPIERDRNLIVVDAPNGFGKSSLLEAFALGLFGRAALTELEISQEPAVRRAERRRSYRTTMEGTLHRSERARDEGMCAVVLDFATADGPVSVERRWYFEEGGFLIEEDEELFVRVGEDRHLVEAPEGLEQRDWNQQEVERRIMPIALAPFFLFDGERLERWVDGRLSDRVRSALRRLLGLDDLAGLVQDLRAYARDRDRLSGDGPSDLGDAELERLEAELQAERGALAGVEGELDRLRSRRNAAMGEISSLSGGAHADLRDLFERRHRLEEELRVARRGLLSEVVDHGPIILAGPRLASSLAVTLAADAEGAALRSIDPAVVELLWAAFSQVDPPLGPAAAVDARRRLLAATAELSADDGDPGRTPIVGTPVARSAITRLEAAGRRGAEAVDGALRALESVRGALAALEGEEQDRRGADARRAEVQAELAGLAEGIEANEAARGGAVRQIRELGGRIGPLREQAERRASLLRDAEPRLRRASAARAIAARISGQLDELARVEHDRFADAVSDAYALLAHKGDVRRVRIGDDGSVSIFDVADRDVTAFRRSAGEGQLFAMALIAAVGSVVGDRLPLVVDTPLARLDTTHRRNLLRMFGARRAQTILLTQPEEMTPMHREEIGPSIAAALWIDHRLDDRSGVGVSRFATGPVGEQAR